MPSTEKLEGIKYLQDHAQRVGKSSKIVIIGGGAVGVQMATDIKELYPTKSVTLVHSRQVVMNNFHPQLHEIVKARCAELGIELVVGSRVKLPPNGYPTSGDFYVELQDGTKIPSDLAVGTHTREMGTWRTNQLNLPRLYVPVRFRIRIFSNLCLRSQLTNPGSCASCKPCSSMTQSTPTSSRLEMSPRLVLPKQRDRNFFPHSLSE